MISKHKQHKQQSESLVMAKGSYAPLLDKTRIPQPSLQKLAVIAIFDKFRNELQSDAGRDAVSRCLRSAVPAVVDQATREICRLIKDSKLDVFTGLLELQSALEGTPSPQFNTVFIKAIGLLTRLGFQENPSSFRFYSPENHPFVKILCCRTEAHGELVKQVTMFVLKCNYLGMETVSEFLRPFLNYSIIKVPYSSSSSAFLMNLVNAMAAFCCSYPSQALSIMKLLADCLKYFPCRNAEEATTVTYFLECIVNSYLVVLRQLVGMISLVREAQLCGLILLQAVLSLHADFRRCLGGVEKILDVSKRLLAVQKEVGLNYASELSSVMVTLFLILTQSELEHEQYYVLVLVLFLLEWKHDNEYVVGALASQLSGELLFIFPVLALVTSPCWSIKQSATDILSLMGEHATNLPLVPKEKQVLDQNHSPISSLGHIVLRLLRNLWFEDELMLDGFFYANRLLRKGYANEEGDVLTKWTFSVREYFSGIVKKGHSSLSISQSEDISLAEVSMIVCSFTSVLLLHPTKNSAIDILALCSNVVPKTGVPLLLLILYYSHIFSIEEKSKDSSAKQLELLHLLPSVASHSAMIPLLLQILLPMCHNDANPVLKATAIRLICKTWEINDLVFGNLQGMLQPNGILHAAESDISVCVAVSIQDVCKRNPDRGVDIILSVEACIENDDPLVQCLGLQSLAHLCEADVIDFYTAWDVIEKHTQNYLDNAIVAYGLCPLLQWGARDFEAYTEAGSSVLNILWDIGTHTEGTQSSLWTRAQQAAIIALLQYEVANIQSSISDFSTKNFQFLISGPNTDLLTALEAFEIRIINHEHISRRRYASQKVISGSGSKIVRLLGGAPEVFFRSGSIHRIKELPGAALLCPSAHKDVNSIGLPKGLLDLNREYEDSAVEISASLQLSRNILLALFSLQSWKPFMERWLRSCISELEAKAHPAMLDISLKAAKNILKTLTRLADEAIPRSAENIALALGAFCMILPASAHEVKSMASKFLLSWLCQYEHEYRQWPAAISLGLISSCLHLTDHEQKLRIINALLEAASISKNTLVGGACGIGLGFSCQDLLTRFGSASGTAEKDTHRMKETELLRKIIWTLVQMVCRFSGSSSTILEKLAACFPRGVDESSGEVSPQTDDIDHLEEGAWGVAGPIIGLGNSLGALYRAGANAAVLYLKDLIISWIPTANICLSNSFTGDTFLAMSALGACLAIPTTVFFCDKVALMDDSDLDHLMNGFMEIISELLSVKRSDSFHQSLLMASCAGAGSILSISLNSGLLLEVEHVTRLLALFKRTYSSPHPQLIRLGGMLGVVNSMGAGAGTLIQHFPLHLMPTTPKQEELSNVIGPLLSNHALEVECTLRVQELFLVAHNSDDPQVQQCAAWAISFLRHFIFSRRHANEKSAVPNESGVYDSVSQRFAEDNLVMNLSSWLMNTNYSKLATSIDMRTLAFCFRCLSHAPRLPLLDWRAVVIRYMKFGGQFTEMSSQDVPFDEGSLREACFLFLLSHASKSDSLLSFLDELYDLARFKSLEPNLQSLMLLHLADLFDTFSNTRLVKLFDDMAYFLHWHASSDQYKLEQKSSLRVSCWKGLQLCVNKSGLETRDYANHLEQCMVVLFTMLPWSYSDTSVDSYQKSYKLEWFEAIQCLAKAQQSWLLDLLLVSDADFRQQNDGICKHLKKVQAKIALVRVGSIPLPELAKLKAYIMNIKSEVIWSILVELALTLRSHDEGIRKQWLVDTSEILCVTSYPSTALRFLGLLCGSSCKYMLVLSADKFSVLSDLPFTLASLLDSTGWATVGESLALYLWKSTQRVHDWSRHIEQGAYLPGSQPIDESENDIAVLLLQVMHQSCISLKEHLPAEKRLKLANMTV